jgi:hypothetical protein
MKVRFSGIVDVPEGTPVQDVEDWLSFELGASCMLSGHNAILKNELSDPKVDSVQCEPEY